MRDTADIGTLRAGPYAEYRGRVYRSVRLDKPMVRLFASGSGPCPDGFERNHRGLWTAWVPREEVSRLFEVETAAVWRGYWVDVSTVDDGLATFTYWGTDFPMTPAITRFQYDGWNGTVPVEELEDVIEIVHEIPV